MKKWLRVFQIKPCFFPVWPSMTNSVALNFYSYTSSASWGTLYYTIVDMHFISTILYCGGKDYLLYVHLDELHNQINLLYSIVCVSDSRCYIHLMHYSHFHQMPPGPTFLFSYKVNSIWDVSVCLSVPRRTLVWFCILNILLPFSRSMFMTDQHTISVTV